MCTVLTYKMNLETVEQTFVPNTIPIGIRSKYLNTMYNKGPLADKLYR